MNELAYQLYDKMSGLERWEEWHSRLGSCLPPGMPEMIEGLKVVIRELEIQIRKENVTNEELAEAQAYVGKRTAREKAWQMSITGQLKDAMHPESAYYPNELPMGWTFDQYWGTLKNGLHANDKGMALQALWHILSLAQCEFIYDLDLPPKP